MPLNLGPFLNWGAGIAAVMMIVWLFRIKSKGMRAVVMAVAFGIFAGVLMLIKAEADQWMIVASGIVLFVLLVTDAFMRTAEIPDGEAETKDETVS